MEADWSFEQALQRLEDIVQELESGALNLEHSVALFEEGVELSAFCREVLQRTDARVEVLRRQLNGEWQAEALELE